MSSHLSRDSKDEDLTDGNYSLSHKGQPPLGGARREHLLIKHLIAYDLCEVFFRKDLFLRVPIFTSTPCFSQKIPSAFSSAPSFSHDLPHSFFFIFFLSHYQA